MPKAGFQPAITASERSKTVHASDRSATATGLLTITFSKNSMIYDLCNWNTVDELGKNPSTGNSRLLPQSGFTSEISYVNSQYLMSGRKTVSSLQLHLIQMSIKPWCQWQKNMSQSRRVAKKKGCPCQVSHLGLSARSRSHSYTEALRLFLTWHSMLNKRCNWYRGLNSPRFKISQIEYCNWPLSISQNGTWAFTEADPDLPAAVCEWALCLITD
jgi:hypothetical protein